MVNGEIGLLLERAVLAAGEELKLAPDFATETYPAKGQLLKMVHAICKHAALVKKQICNF
jgi:hypothetical protein